MTRDHGDLVDLVLTLGPPIRLAPRQKNLPVEGPGFPRPSFVAVPARIHPSLNQRSGRPCAIAFVQPTAKRLFLDRAVGTEVTLDYSGVGDALAHEVGVDTCRG